MQQDNKGHHRWGKSGRTKPVSRGIKPVLTKQSKNTFFESILFLFVFLHFKQKKKQNILCVPSQIFLTGYDMLYSMQYTISERSHVLVLSCHPERNRHMSEEKTDHLKKEWSRQAYLRYRIHPPLPLEQEWSNCCHWSCCCQPSPPDGFVQQLQQT